MIEMPSSVTLLNVIMQIHQVQQSSIARGKKHYRKCYSCKKYEHCLIEEIQIRSHKMKLPDVSNLLRVGVDGGGGFYMYGVAEAADKL